MPVHGSVQRTEYTMAEVLLPMSIVIWEEATLTAGCTPNSSISGVRIRPASSGNGTCTSQVGFVGSRVWVAGFRPQVGST